MVEGDDTIQEGKRTPPGSPMRGGEKKKDKKKQKKKQKKQKQEEEKEEEKEVEQQEEKEEDNDEKGDEKEEEKEEKDEEKSNEEQEQKEQEDDKEKEEEEKEKEGNDEKDQDDKEEKEQEQEKEDKEEQEEEKDEEKEQHKEEQQHKQPINLKGSESELVTRLLCDSPLSFSPPFSIASSLSSCCLGKWEVKRVAEAIQTSISKEKLWMKDNLVLLLSYFCDDDTLLAALTVVFQDSLQKEKEKGDEEDFSDSFLTWVMTSLKLNPHLVDNPLFASFQDLISQNKKKLQFETKKFFDAVQALQKKNSEDFPYAFPLSFSDNPKLIQNLSSYGNGEEIATQISLISFFFLERIPLRELTCSSFFVSYASPHLAAYRRWLRVVEGMVLKDYANSETQKQKLAFFSRYLRFLQIFRKYKNYEGIKIVFSILQEIDGKVKILLPKSDNDLYEEFVQFYKQIAPQEHPAPSSLLSALAPSSFSSSAPVASGPPSGTRFSCFSHSFPCIPVFSDCLEEIKTAEDNFVKHQEKGGQLESDVITHPITQAYSQALSKFFQNHSLLKGEMGVWDEDMRGTKGEMVRGLFSGVVPDPDICFHLEHLYSTKADEGPRNSELYHQISSSLYQSVHSWLSSNSKGKKQQKSERNIRLAQGEKIFNHSSCFYPYILELKALERSMKREEKDIQITVHAKKYKMLSEEIKKVEEKRDDLLQDKKVREWKELELAGKGPSETVLVVDSLLESIDSLDKFFPKNNEEPSSEFVSSLSSCLSSCDDVSKKMQ